MFELSMRRLRRMGVATILAALVSCLGATLAAADEIEPGWQPGDGVRGVDGKVNTAVLWDRDGAGPEPARLVVGGAFAIAGTTQASNIALWNGETWEALGTPGAEGTSGEVLALAVLADGSLAVGGSFQGAGGAILMKVARWDGGTWSAFGSGIGPAASAAVRAMLVLADGSLVVAGRFGTAGGAVARNIARWDGSAWTEFAGGISPTNTVIDRLLPDGAGGLLVCGFFTQAGGVAVQNIARWSPDASASPGWSPLGPGLSGSVSDLLPLADGELLASGGPLRVYRWDGASWIAMNAGIGTGSAPTALARMADGTLVAGGASRMQFWNGSAWTPLAGGIPGWVNTLLTLEDGSLLAGGDFLQAGQVHAASLARYADGRWHFLNPGLGGVTRTQVFAFLEGEGHERIAGGSFTAAGTVEASKVARWDGRRWHAMGGGLTGGDVRALARLPDGSILAGGTFDRAEGATARGLARWDGSRWEAFGSGTGSGSYEIAALAVTPDGDPVVAGSFTSLGGVAVGNLARWDGVTWRPIGGASPSSSLALAVLDNGHLVVAGEFTTMLGRSFGRIARWDGSEWSDMAGGMNAGVYALRPLPGGRLLAVGRFGQAGGVPANRVALWDGEAWSGVGGNLSPSSPTPTLRAIEVLADGDLVIGGNFRLSDSSAVNLARLRDGVWRAVGTGADGAFDSNVYALTAMPDGGFAVGGGFTRMDGEVNSYFARWGLPLPPPVLLTIRDLRLGPEGLGFRFEGRPGARHAVQYSTDLRHWTTLATDLGETLEFLDSDPERRAEEGGFYRVIEQP